MKYQALIEKMTLEEKASLMSGKDFWHTVDIPRLGIPSITLSDGPHGLRKQSGAADHLGLNASLPATCYPTAATVANSWDPELGEELGKHLGIEALAQQVNVILGPGLNIKRSPLCGRNFEYFSEDPYLSGKMAAGYIRGIQSQGVAACPKHFAANSQELRRMSNDSVVDERTFREIYTTGFEIAVREGRTRSIMTSYNRINGTYANENSHLLEDILVKEWGFDGFVVSDWGGSNSHVDGVAAGSQLEMPTSGKDGIRELTEAVKSGKLSESLLDKRVDELLDAVFTLTNAAKEHSITSFDTEAHHAMAQRAAEESIVLLKNEAGILPLKKETKVALIGDFAAKPRYQGAGSSIVNPTKVESILEEVKHGGLNSIGYEQGYHRNGQLDEKLIHSAAALAEKAEAVLLFLGLDELAESEGMDREHLKLAQNQTDLLAAIERVNPKVIVIFSAGAVTEMDWQIHARAILHGYLGGQAGASAMIHAITGEVNPSGKLNETYPLHYEDTPSAPYYPGKERTSEYREGLFVGYRYYESAGVPVAFPFGFGLSYTTFAYENLTADTKKVTLTVKNTGSVDGAEVVQIYISAMDSRQIRPVRELKGFQKVFLKAGESADITIELDDKAFRYYNTRTETWETESGTYLIQAAASVQDIRLKQEVMITGTEAAIAIDKDELPSYQSMKIQQIPDAEFRKLLGREIPPAKWENGGLLTINDAFCQMYYARNPLARLVYRILTGIKNQSMKKGNPNLNVLFIYNMPFRGLAKMTGGAVTMEMAEGILDIVNGHFFRGMKKLVGGFFRNLKKA